MGRRETPVRRAGRLSRTQRTRLPRSYTRKIRAVYTSCGEGEERGKRRGKNEGKVKRKERKEDATIIHERTRGAKERQRRANGERTRRRMEHDRLAERERERNNRGGNIGDERQRVTETERERRRKREEDGEVAVEREKGKRTAERGGVTMVSAGLWEYREEKGMKARVGRKRGTTRARVQTSARCIRSRTWGSASARTYVAALHIELARRIEY